MNCYGLFLVFLFLAAHCWANENSNGNIQFVKDGPVHESYIIQEFGQLILQYVPNEPPEEITELIPIQDDSQAKWIPGYWGWSEKYSQFLWVSGVWRRPPPGRTWVKGYWKQHQQQWVWIRGFWSDVAEEGLTYISTPPPDAIDEKVVIPPDPAQDYFWVPGTWKYEASENTYVWYSGRWEMLEGHWVYVPPQYLWRELGYVFVPGFWDWPIDDRGAVFSSISVKPNAIQSTIYQPSEALEPLYLIELYFPTWPNYYCLFRYHYYYHNNVWASWGAAPNWWNWPTWWALPWRDLWWVWWWWTHPGYPNPTWITEGLAKKMDPPMNFVVKMMERVEPPVNITLNGVVGNIQILKALKIASGKTPPILPSDPKQVQQIQQLAQGKQPTPPFLRPEGSMQAATPPIKPFFGPTKASIKVSGEPIEIPSRPIAAPKGLDHHHTLFPFEGHTSSNGLRLKPKYLLLDLPKYIPIRHEVHPSHPEILEPDLYYEQQTGPHDRTPHRPHYQPPRQGYTQNYAYPQTPMQLQHQDRLMTNPQPRRNPIEPKVYQTPGDRSTGPG